MPGHPHTLIIYAVNMRTQLGHTETKWRVRLGAFFPSLSCWEVIGLPALTFGEDLAGLVVDALSIR